MTGCDAPKVVTLFKGMAVMAEDQVVAVPILCVLWLSIDAKKHKKITPMKARQWTNQLLARSILLGSSEGVSMHDSK